MKHLSTILLSVVMLTACSKSADKSASRATASIAPSITSAIASVIYEAGDEKVSFAVNLVADSTTVDDVTLYLYPSKMRWQVLKPSTGMYTMYDHIGQYRSGTQYNFTFHMHDGTTVDIKPFAIP